MLPFALVVLARMMMMVSDKEHLHYLSGTKR